MQFTWQYSDHVVILQVAQEMCELCSSNQGSPKITENSDESKMKRKYVCYIEHYSRINSSSPSDDSGSYKFSIQSSNMQRGLQRCHWNLQLVHDLNEGSFCSGINQG